MADKRVENLAKILVQYSTRIRPGDHVAIIGSPLAEPLIKEVMRQVLRAGGFPYPMLGLEMLRGMASLQEVFFKEASKEQLEHVLQTDRMIFETFESMITIRGQENTRSLTNVDPEKFVHHSRARSEIKEIYVQRSASDDFRWCTTLYPTDAYAQEADMSLREFEDFVYGATYADTKDPVAKWDQIAQEQKVLVDWLAGKEHVEITGPNVDLTLSITNRTFINSHGLKNMPSGEIYTSPVEDSVNGWVKFTYPAIRDGREVDGIYLRFEDGRVEDATAEKNENYLQSMLDSDPGARYLGEFAIGTNKRIDRFIKSILYDEKIGGTFHMALGYGFPQVGSKNKSNIHWDMICDMRDGGEIHVDGELFYKSGEFLV
jgi:aminopeptidase